VLPFQYPPAKQAADVRSLLPSPTNSDVVCAALRLLRRSSQDREETLAVKKRISPEIARMRIIRGNNRQKPELEFKMPETFDAIRYRSGSEVVAALKQLGIQLSQRLGARIYFLARKGIQLSPALLEGAGPGTLLEKAFLHENWAGRS
jgi:hypothetical protein